jgi:glycosyltransferase involved in cell wall biosynthesis
MLRRVVLISDLAVERDGATAVAMSAVRALRRHGVAVTYVCGDDGRNAELGELGVEVVPVQGQEIGKANRFGAAVAGLYNAKAAKVLGNVIKRVDGEGVVYHLHNWSKILSPAIFQVLHGVSERLLISTHDYFLACPNGGFFNFKKKTPCELVPLSAACLATDCDRRSYLEKIWRVVRSLTLRAMIDLSRKRATILAVHDGMVSHLVRGGIAADCIKVLRNPVAPWSETRIAVENNRKFLFVGRLDHDKGAELLAQSARDAGVPIQMVGEGPLRVLLEQSYPEAELMGWQPRQRVAQIARDARTVVMPTGSRETFGLVAFEALTSGIPVIISKFAATSDEIVRNEVGFACDPYDATTLADLLKTMASDDGRLRQMSERAWQARGALAPGNEGWGDRLMAIYQDAGRAAAPQTGSAAVYGA